MTDTTTRRLPQPGDTLHREALLEPLRADDDTDTREVALAFSSETPVRRWFGEEILDHSPGAVRMARITSGAPLLLEHDRAQQIGVVTSARLDADKTARATVKISRSARGEEILQDIRDGIRTKVSVGYVVHDMTLERQGDDGDVYRVTDWEPVEVSLVSIPADDIGSGVGRAHPAPLEDTTMSDDKTQGAADSTAVEQRAEIPTPTPAPAVPEHPQAEQIRAVGRHFNLAREAEDHIMLGGDLDAFRALVRERMPQPEPVPAAPRIEARIPHAASGLRAFRPDAYAGGRREMEEQAYRAGQWASATIFGNAQAARWCRDHGMPLSERVLSGVGAGQSVLVPEELATPIISLREQYGMARRLCYVHPMTTDTTSVPRDTGDVTAYFVGREEAPTASDPSFDNVNLVAKNVSAETRINNDYAEDSVINLADHVAEKHARAFAIKEDTCLINGDGTSAYGGIVGLRTAILSLAGAVDAASGHDTFAEITAADLRSVMAALPDLPGISPVWIASKVAQNAVFGRLSDAAGGNARRDLGERMPEMYAGYMIETSPAMPKVLTDLSDVAMLLFGDLRLGVIFGDRRGMTMMVDPYSLSSYQQTKIISSERFDINCHGVGDASTAGPIVALIGE